MNWSSLLRRAAYALVDALRAQASQNSGRAPQPDEAPRRGTSSRGGRPSEESGRSPRPAGTMTEEEAARHGGTLSPYGSASAREVTSSTLPEFDYAPHADGDADPGEVVWTWVPFEDIPEIGKDRPVLVLAHHGKNVIVLQLTSKDHDRDAADEARFGRYWLDIGSGDWDHRGRDSEVRIDRLLEVGQSAVRREGGVLDRNRFDQVVAAVQDAHRRGL